MKDNKTTMQTLDMTEMKDVRAGAVGAATLLAISLTSAIVGAGAGAGFAEARECC